MNLSDLLLNKWKEVILFRDDIISEEEDPNGVRSIRLALCM